MRQDQDLTACPLYSASPQAQWTQRNEGEVGAGRRTFLRLREGRGESHRLACTHETPTHTYTWHSCVHLTHAPHSHTPASFRPFCSQLDHCLQEASPCYKSLRFRGSVGPARVHLVGPGAFRALREALAASPSSPFPPEMPRVLRDSHLAQLLQRRVVS